MFDILGHLDYIRSRASGLLAAQALDLRLPLKGELAYQAGVARAPLVPRGCGGEAAHAVGVTVRQLTDWRT